MRALLIDDERLARNELRRMLRHHPEIEIVGEASDATSALSAIQEFAPDLIFLDIQMPGRDGFQLLEELDSVPAVIFTTAYDEHAIRAFEVNALDYLLKPLEADRLQNAVLKALRSRTAAPHLDRRLSLDSRIFVKDGNRCWFTKLESVRLFESEGNYARVHFSNERPLIHRSLNYLEARLRPGDFFRAGRRHLVGLRWVRGMAPNSSGGLTIQLEGGPAVEMSRRQARRFRETMGL